MTLAASNFVCNTRRREQTACRLIILGRHYFQHLLQSPRKRLVHAYLFRGLCTDMQEKEKTRLRELAPVGRREKKKEARFTQTSLPIFLAGL